MASRSRGLTNHSARNPAKIPAWILRRASERPVARWIDWAAKRRQVGRDAVEAQPESPAVWTATIIYIDQWKAARRR